MIQLIAGGVLVLLYRLVRPALDSSRWGLAIDLSRVGLLWAVLGFVVLALIFEPWILPILIPAIMIHEYGHVLAYRLAGHRAPIFRLAPFGGVAMSHDRSLSEAENAFVALMGPGISLAPLVIAVALQDALAGVVPTAAAWAYQVAALIGLLNLFNLLPIFPLDGGRVLTALASLGGPWPQRIVAVGSVLLLALGAALASLPLLGLVAGFGLVMALAEGARFGRAPRLGATDALVTLVAYAACFGAHFIAAAPYIALFLTRLP